MWVLRCCRCIASFDDEELPEALADALHKWVTEYHYRATNMDELHLVRVDLNRDERADYVLLQTNKNFNSGVLFTGTDGEWKYLNMTLRN